jgi:hypothetical protein
LAAEVSFMGLVALAADVALAVALGWVSCSMR